MPKKANLEDLEELRKRPGKIHKINNVFELFQSIPRTLTGNQQYIYT